MNGYLRWGIIVGVIVAVLWAGAYYGGQWLSKATQPTFTTAEVSRGRVENVVNSTGTVKAVQTVNIGSFVSGPILKINVDFNGKFMPGDLLGEIDPRLLKAAYDRDVAAVAREKAAWEREKATLQTQMADLERVQALLTQAVRNEKRALALRKEDRDYISDTEVDQFTYNRASLDAQLKVARAAIEQGKAAVNAQEEAYNQAVANLENSKTNLGYCKIIAPMPKPEGSETEEDVKRIPGRVIERKVDPGQTVAASFQTPEMFVIAYRMDRKMHIHANVDEADIGQVLTAQARKGKVKFTVDAWPQQVFEGTIFEVRRNSTTTQNVVTYPVVIEAPNPGEKLFPGMTANISFEIEVRENVTRIPAAALRFMPTTFQVREQDRKYLTAGPTDNEAKPQLSATQKVEANKARARRVVWVKHNDGLHAVPVVLGLIDNQYAELIEGDLKVGDELVTGIQAIVRSN
jgi:HlyD family secretion protein